MSVRCEGDLRVMEQLGERQDFEAELTRLGFTHEEFTINVRRDERSRDRDWSIRYTVWVTNVVNRRGNAYFGTAGRTWVTQFVADAERGHFGDPQMGALLSSRSARLSVRVTRRAWKS
ncbi:MAG TPA: hypothetical protein VGH59_07455 [Casimicrobiaceae bacterium]